MIVINEEYEATIYITLMRENSYSAVCLIASVFAFRTLLKKAVDQKPTGTPQEIVDDMMADYSMYWDERIEETDDDQHYSTPSDVVRNFTKAYGG